MNMEITVVGLNHKTASVDIRERLAFDTDAVKTALQQLKEKFPKAEFILLSTCNRVELYFATELSESPDTEDIVSFLSDFRGVSVDEFRRFLYVRHNENSVSHLLTVTSSLDSMVVGESQINAQVKESYRIACQVKSTGKVLNYLFHTAFNTSKEIYTNTSITNRRVSVAGVAVDLAKQLFENIKKAKVVVVGAGDMGELLVEHFLHIKCNDITVVNRSARRGKELAEKHNITAYTWENMDEQLLEANIVVAAATAAQGYLFDKKTFADIMEKRRGKTFLLIDIAVPRNFAPEVNEIENVYVYSVDDLAQVVQENIELREEDLDQAVEIICDKVAGFMDWLGSKDIGPMIGQLKESFDRIRKNETERFFVAERQEASCRNEMEAMIRRVVNKLLHCVIKNVNSVAKQHGPDEAAKLVNDIVCRAETISDESDIEKEN